MTSNEKAKIVEMRENKASYTQIAVELHIPINSVKSFCRRHALGGSRSNNVRSFLPNPSASQQSATPPVISETILRAPVVQSSCEQCSRTVNQTPGRKLKRFCSDSCRMKWWSVHHNEINRALHHFTCSYCGQAFDRAVVRSFCSRSCAALARQQRRNTHDD